LQILLFRLNKPNDEAFKSILYCRFNNAVSFACKKDAVVDLNKLVQVDSAQLAQGALVTVTRDTTTVTHFYQAAGSFVVTLMVMANPNNMLAKVSFGVKALGQQTKPEYISSALVPS
jgi:hypothetical protein